MYVVGFALEPCDLPARIFLGYGHTQKYAWELQTDPAFRMSELERVFGVCNIERSSNPGIMISKFVDGKVESVEYIGL